MSQLHKNTFIGLLIPLACLVVCFQQVVAQPVAHTIQVSVEPNHEDWKYKTGENVEFQISVRKSNVLLKNVSISYEISPIEMPVIQKETKTLATGTTTIQVKGIKEPGFLRCKASVEIDGEKYEGMATAGFDPEQIKPTVKQPADFISWWKGQIEEARKVPLDLKMTPYWERCTDKAMVYLVSFQTQWNGARIYGVLSVPKAEGKYPALLLVPGAGVRSYKGDVGNAENGIITLEIGIHGIPVNLPENVYSDLLNCALNGYWNAGIQNKKDYYYHRVYLGCLRAIDVITSQPMYDGKTLGVTGYSQGGALSLMLTALDSRVKFAGVAYPALCDLTGYLHGRAGGWPHSLKNADPKSNETAVKVETLGYYDAVNFAREIKVPVYFIGGYNDDVCPPTSFYSVYNSISSEKEFYVVPEIGHWVYPELGSRLYRTVSQKIKEIAQSK